MTKVAKKTQPISKAVVKSAELVVKDKEISYDQIWQFVQENAGGNEANVKIIPLSSVDLKSKTPLPFGYNGKPGGVRETIQNWMPSWYKW